MFNPFTFVYIMEMIWDWVLDSQRSTSEIMEGEADLSVPGLQVTLLILCLLWQSPNVWAWHRCCHLNTPIIYVQPYSTNPLALTSTSQNRGSSSPLRSRILESVQSSVGQGGTGFLWTLTLYSSLWGRRLGQRRRGRTRNPEWSPLLLRCGHGVALVIFLLLGEKKLI